VRKFRVASFFALLAVGAISLPLLASPVAAVAAAPRAPVPIGKQLAELKGSDTAAVDQFGYSVAISGTTAIVGAPDHGGYTGRAYVFTKTAGGWKQAAELKGSGTAAGDQFGWSVAISGTTAIVGAPYQAGEAGRAYVFIKTAGGWKQAAELNGSDTAAADLFGYSVAISGATAVVGAPIHAEYAGRAYVFTKTRSGWKQAAELKGSDTVADDRFGASVAISGATAVVGAYYANVGGRAYVFTKTRGGWKQAAELKGAGTAGSDLFGWSVAVSGATAIVGVPYYATHAGDVGLAYVFTKTPGGWKQAAELKGSGAVDYFGTSVAISGATAVVGAPNHSGDAGRAYVFTKTRGRWKLAATLKGSDTAASDQFGAPVAVSGATAVVGAPAHADGGRAYAFQA
jgi:nucleoside-specific outer membrane channel protein Tsx